MIYETIWFQHNYHGHVAEAADYGAVIIPDRVLATPRGEQVGYELQDLGKKVICYSRHAHDFLREEVPASNWWTEAAERAFVEHQGATSRRIADPARADRPAKYWYDRTKLSAWAYGGFLERKLGGIAGWCNGFLFDHLSGDAEYTAWQLESVELSYLNGWVPVMFWNGTTSTVVANAPGGVMVESMGKHWSDSDEPLELVTLLAPIQHPVILDTFRVPDLQPMADAIAAQRELQGRDTYIMRGRMRSDGFHTA